MYNCQDLWTTIFLVDQKSNKDVRNVWKKGRDPVYWEFNLFLFRKPWLQIVNALQNEPHALVLD